MKTRTRVTLPLRTAGWRGLSLRELYAMTPYKKYGQDSMGFGQWIESLVDELVAQSWPVTNNYTFDKGEQMDDHLGDRRVTLMGGTVVALEIKSGLHSSWNRGHTFFWERVQNTNTPEERAQGGWFDLCQAEWLVVVAVGQGYVFFFKMARLRALLAQVEHDYPLTTASGWMHSEGHPVPLMWMIKTFLPDIYRIEQYAGPDLRAHCRVSSRVLSVEAFLARLAGGWQTQIPGYVPDELSSPELAPFEA